MVLGKRSIVIRALVVLLALVALTLGVFHLFPRWELTLFLVLCGLAWAGVSGGRDDPFKTLFMGTRLALLLRQDAQFMGQGNYLEVNDAACQRLGYEREEFLRMSPWDLDLLPEGGSMAELRRALAEEGQVVFESNLRTKSGDRCPAEIHVHRLELGGKPMVLSMLRDLTAEKGLERQLLEARKSEALVRQAGTAAHDFNNILQVINGYGTLIQMGMGEDDPNRHAMEEILRATDRGAQLARSLLEKH